MDNNEAFSVDQPFVTQEQKFKYWQESKAHIKALEAAQQQSAGEIAELKADNETLVQVNNKLANEVLEVSEMYEARIDHLDAHINDLREALNAMRDVFDVGGDVTSVENNALYKADTILAKTPAQSLQAHDDSLIEKCAKIADNALWAGKVAGDKIRELKGKL